jgi:hypothetical protein
VKPQFSLSDATVASITEWGEAMRYFMTPIALVTCVTSPMLKIVCLGQGQVCLDKNRLMAFCEVDEPTGNGSPVYVNGRISGI